MTTKAFVIGHPIAHSRSPLIHGTWLRDLGIDGSYEPIDVGPEALPGFVARLRAGEFAGGNVTIPLKEQVFALCDSVDPLARTIGAVNTLVVNGGQVHGFNTDFMGFLGNLDQAAAGWSDGLGEAIVFGAGGASRAVLVALRERGIPTIHLLNRTAGKAEALADEMGRGVRAAPLTAFVELAPHAGLVVNTTSIGMHGTAFPQLPLERLPPSALVTDIVYIPLETPLLAEARALGLKTVDGLGMLLHQAVPGFEAWFGVRPQVTPALRDAVASTLR
ncbi:MAG: shikimate dehydrogenase [Devosia sp.]|nr:shikimate dehydrogenase [Devosia sp.]